MHFNNPGSKCLDAPGLKLGRVTITRYLGIILLKHYTRHMIFSGLNNGNSILCCELTVMVCNDVSYYIKSNWNKLHSYFVWRFLTDKMLKAYINQCYRLKLKDKRLKRKDKRLQRIDKILQLQDKILQLNIVTLNCHCLWKPGRARGWRSAVRLQTFTTFSLSDMITIGGICLEKK